MARLARRRRILNNGGPHGFSEIMYAYTSGAGNNGSAFAGINANTPWYNLTIGIDMLIARFLFIIPALAIAGSLAAKETHPRYQRHFADAWFALCGSADWNHHHRRRADVFPGAFAGSDC